VRNQDGNSVVTADIKRLVSHVRKIAFSQDGKACSLGDQSVNPQTVTFSRTQAAAQLP